MLRRSCLLNNGHLITNLKRVVELTGNRLLAAGKTPDFEVVYNTLRAADVEIDIQTAADLYAATFPLGINGFTSQKTLDTLSGKTFRAIEKQTHTTLRRKEIGKDAPSVAAVAAVFKAILPSVGSSPTIQKMFQDRLTKWAKNKLEVKNVATQGKSWDAMLHEALMLTIPQTFNPIGVRGYLATTNELQQEFKDLFADLALTAGTPYQNAQIQDYAAMLAAVPHSLMLSTAETKAAITGIFAKAGFTKTVNTKSGPKEVVDWDAMRRANPDFRAVVTQVLTDQGFNPRDIPFVIQSLEQDYDKIVEAKREAKLDQRNKAITNRKTRQEKSNLEKFLELYDLGAFQAPQQDALLRLLGVATSDINLIRKIEDMMRISNRAMRTDMTKWSESFMKSVALEIENSLEIAEESKDGWLTAIRAFSHFVQLGQGAILTNYLNIFENIFSGLSEMFFAAIVSGNWSQFTAVARTFGTVYADVVAGGVRVGKEHTNVNDLSGNVEDRYNLARSKTFKDKLVAFGGLLQRAALSAPDAAVKAGLIHMMAVNTASKVLIRKNPGMTKGESIAILNELYYANGAQIEQHADLLMATLKSLGRKPTRFTKQRMIQEISLGNLASQNSIFEDTLTTLIAEGEINAHNGYVGIGEEIFASITAAASSTAGKGLGHEADIVPLKIVTATASAAAESVQKARRSHDSKALRSAELGRVVVQLAFPFRGGMLRWTWLSVSKASFVPAAIIFSSELLRGKLKNYNLDKVDLELDDQAELTKQLNDHLSQRNRMSRMVVGTVMSSLIGYGIILPYILGKFKDDEEDEGLTEEEKIAAAGARAGKWIREDNATNRWAQKGLPLASYGYLLRQTYMTPGYEVKDRHITDDMPPLAPGMEDYFNPLDMFQLVGAQWQNTLPVEFVNDFKTEFDKKKGDPAKLTMQYVGKFLNLGAMASPPESFRESNRALDRIQDKLAGGPGVSESTLTPYQREELKAENKWEAFLKGTFRKDMYASITGRDAYRDKIAPVHPAIIELYKSTGNLDFLPPSPRATIEIDGIRFGFTDPLAREYQLMVNDAYMAATTDLVENWSTLFNSQDTGEKIEELKDLYKDAREAARDAFLYKYPMETYGKPVRKKVEAE